MPEWFLTVWNNLLFWRLTSLVVLVSLVILSFIMLRQIWGLREKVGVDHLTGLANFRRFEASLTYNLKLGRRNQQPVSLLVIDLDKLKTINDTHGHMVGNQVLVAVASAIRESVRATDLTARIGGDEFAAILSGSTLAGAKKVARDIQKAVRTIKVDRVSEITVSIGVMSYSASANEEELDPSALIERADKALYDAKKAGGNQICLV